MRCRDARRALPGHTCGECQNFVNVLCEGEEGEVFDRDAFMSCSRHRAAHSPNHTPDGFWELSFASEIEAHERQSR